MGSRSFHNSRPGHSRAAASRLCFISHFQADGFADSRTLHTGEDAEDTTKFVIQQWVALGHGALPAAAVEAAAAAATSVAPEGAGSGILAESASVVAAGQQKGKKKGPKNPTRK